MSIEDTSDSTNLTVRDFEGGIQATKPASPSPPGWAPEDLLSPSLRHFPLPPAFIPVPDIVPGSDIRSFRSIAEQPFPRWPCDEDEIWQAWQDRINALIQLRMLKIVNAELNSIFLLAGEKMPWDLILILAHCQGVDAMWRLMNEQPAQSIRRLQCCLLLAGLLTTLREWATIELVLRNSIEEFAETEHLGLIKSALCRSALIVGNFDLAAEFANTQVDLALMNILRNEDHRESWSNLTADSKYEVLAKNNIAVLQLGHETLDEIISSLTSLLPIALEPLLYNLATMYELRTNNASVLKDDIYKLLREEAAQTKLTFIEGLNSECLKL